MKHRFKQKNIVVTNHIPNLPLEHAMSIIMYEMTNSCGSYFNSYSEQTKLNCHWWYFFLTNELLHKIYIFRLV